MAAAAYQKAYRRFQVMAAQQKAKQDAMKDAGIKPQQQPPAKPKQKPLAKAPKSGRKHQNRKPPKR